MVDSINDQVNAAEVSKAIYGKVWDGGFRARNSGLMGLHLPSGNTSEGSIERFEAEGVGQ